MSNHATPPASTVGSLGPVICFGVHILDVLGRPVTAIPPGQHSVILDEIRATAAGTAAGPSVDLAKLGVRVTNMGAVGDDVLGDLVVTLLRNHGVDTSLLTRKIGRRTSATILPIRPNGERPALHAPGASGDFAAGDLGVDHVAALAGAVVVHVGGPDALTSFDPVALADLLVTAKAAGAIVTMDVLRSADPADLERLVPILAHVDWFMPNDDQLRALTGCADLTPAMGVVRSLGVGGVAVTLGEAGCVVDDGTSVTAIPAMEVSVVDTTGCGDGFDAGFILGLLAGTNAVEAAWIGTVCGGLVATGLGSDAGIIDLTQVRNLLEGFSDDPLAQSAAAILHRVAAGVAPEQLK